MAVITSCKKCGNEFIAYPSAGREYCSRDCYYSSKLWHGESRSKLYMVWNSMRQRCGNPNDRSYAEYGGRGISVCQEWQVYSVFRAWAYANGYGAGLQIDRANNNCGYSPENCRWVTGKQNSANTRKSRNGTSKYKGVCWNARDRRWLAKLSNDGKSKHLGNHKTALAAAIAYDNAAYEIRGEFALLNFPERKRITTPTF